MGNAFRIQDSTIPETMLTPAKNSIKCVQNLNNPQLYQVSAKLLRRCGITDQASNTKKKIKKIKNT